MSATWVVQALVQDFFRAEQAQVGQDGQIVLPHALTASTVLEDGTLQVAGILSCACLAQLGPHRSCPTPTLPEAFSILEPAKSPCLHAQVEA